MYLAIIMKVLLMEWKGWYNDTVRMVGRNEGGGLETEFNPHLPKFKKKIALKACCLVTWKQILKESHEQIIASGVGDCDERVLFFRTTFMVLFMVLHEGYSSFCSLAMSESTFPTCCVIWVFQARDAKWDLMHRRFVERICRKIK